MLASAAGSAGTRVGSTGNLGAGRLVLPVIRPHGPPCPSQEPGDARVPRRGEAAANAGLTWRARAQDPVQVQRPLSSPPARAS
eukprot:3017715-Pleurochrysis_carterae.AAC.1